MLIVLAVTGSSMAQISPVATPSSAPLAPAVSPQSLMTAPTTALPSSPATAARPKAGNSPSTIRLPLRQLIGAQEPIYLQTAESTYTVFVPLSTRYDVRSCKLRLAFTNSIALLTERSVLRVVLNNRIIGQFYLSREQPNRVVELEVPLNFLEAGSNQLQFIVAQHYTLECEDPGAPELYTQILPDESYLEAVVTWKDVYPKLSLLRDLIDRNLWETYRFHLCNPSGSGMTDTQLSVGSIISQGVALNLGFRPFAVTTSNQLVAGVDNIVVGTMNELTPYLTATEVGSINGSFIAFKQLPNDPTKFLLIISGRNDEEVSQAAYAFSLINFPLPDSQYAQVDSLSFPQKPTYLQNAPMRDPGIFSFRQLGMDKHFSVKGWNTGTYSLEVYMPGDLSPLDGSNVELRLHFVYGAALRKDSVVNVFVNGQFHSAITLDNVRGASVYDQRVYLSLKAFQPGRNVVEIAPRMVPLVTNHCEMLQMENLWFTLYRDSDFVLPRMLLQTRLPNLRLMSQTSFPFAASPDGLDLAVHVAGRDSTSVCAAWMLLGKMSQISGSVLHRTEISFRTPQTKKNLLVVGPVDSLPEEVMIKAPISPQEVGRLRYAMSTAPEPEATAVGPIEEILSKLRGQAVTRKEPEQPATIGMNAKSTLLDDTMAISFENPFHLGRLATVFTAADADKLYRGIYTLQDRRFWDNISGTVAVWNNTPRSLQSTRIGPEFQYGATSLVSRTTNEVNSNPILFTAIVFGALAILAVLLSLLIKRKSSSKNKPSA